MTSTGEAYAVFCGLDVGKSEHHACALNNAGRRLHDKALPNDDPAAVLSAVPVLFDGARQSDATAIGNDAYELARYLIESGRAKFDSAARCE